MSGWTSRAPGEEMVAMNARQCKTLMDKAERAEADGSEIGRLKAAYLRAAATALASGRAATVAKIGRTSPTHYAKYEQERDAAKAAMADAVWKLHKLGIHVKEKRV